VIRISVITPTYDRAEFIEQAIDSATTQSVSALEHIVIDGGSRDDTLLRLRRFSRIQVFSEPDRGLYDAINKGIRRANGDVICLLNSDDRLLPGAFEAVTAAFDADPAVDAVCGRVHVGDSEGGASETEIGTPAMQRLRPGDIISGLPITNARFVRRAVFDRIAPFDQTFPVLADRDFFARFLLAGFRTRAINCAVYRYGTHHGSLSFGSGAGRLAYNIEALHLAATRLEANSGERERAFYRRWLGWAIGYALARGAKEGELAPARLATSAARSTLRGWPAEFAVQALWHWRTRAERRGRAV
jgi:glycosyltransferase involved in cell wall biosynthesis